MVYHVFIESRSRPSFLRVTTMFFFLIILLGRPHSSFYLMNSTTGANGIVSTSDAHFKSCRMCFTFRHPFLNDPFRRLGGGGGGVGGNSASFSSTSCV